MKFADVKNDVAFCKIFANKKKSQFLISFLNAVLQLEGKYRIANNGNLSSQLYVKQVANANEHNTHDLMAEIKAGQQRIYASIENLFAHLQNIGIEA